MTRISDAARQWQSWRPLAGAAIVLTAIAVFVVLADAQRLGPLDFIYQHRHADKLGHFALFGLLSLLVNLYALRLRRRIRARLMVLQVSLVLAGLMALEEVSQALFPTRNADIFDLLAGYAGVAIGAVVALRLSSGR